MMRTFVQLVVVMVALLAVTLVPYGCSATDQDTPWTQADGHADTIAGKLDSAATQVTGSGQDIIATATAGQAATPTEVRPRLDPFWMRLIASGHVLLSQGDALAAVRQDVDSLRAEVKAGQEQLKQALAAVEAEKKGRAADNAAWEAKLAKANSRWEAMFRTISWLAIAAIGVSVTVGVRLKDFRVSVAGGAGGLAVVIACMIVGQIQHWLPWAAGGLAAAVGLWVLIESIVRGSFWEAIKTTPAEDLRELMAPAKATPA
jgi:hypothetical protein